MEITCQMVGDGNICVLKVLAEKLTQWTFRMGFVYKLQQDFYQFMWLECIICEQCLEEGHLQGGQYIHKQGPFTAYHYCADVLQKN